MDDTTNTLRAVDLPRSCSGVPGSPWQEKLLRRLVRAGDGVQLAGHGMAKWISAARALRSRGLVEDWPRTGYYGASPLGKEWVRLNPPNGKLSA